MKDTIQNISTDFFPTPKFYNRNLQPKSVTFQPPLLCKTVSIDNDFIYYFSYTPNTSKPNCHATHWEYPSKVQQCLWTRNEIFKILKKWNVIKIWCITKRYRQPLLTFLPVFTMRRKILAKFPLPLWQNNDMTLKLC